jgi:predicted glutamine amidotransferase
MCVLVYTKNNRRITSKEFENCWYSNPDGFGMAWREEIAGKTVIKYTKGIMTLKEAWKTYQSVKKEQMVLHFRIATAGGVCPELTHPFIISETSPTMLEYTGTSAVLFHNGSVWNWEKEAVPFILNARRRITGKMSDTRFVALKTFPLKATENRVSLLKKESGKYLLFSVDSTWRIGTFEEVNSAFFSNSSYKDYKVVKTSTYNYNNYNYDDGNYYRNKSYNNPASVSSAATIQNEDGAIESKQYGKGNVVDPFFVEGI